jgi:hypothetical protein
MPLPKATNPRERRKIKMENNELYHWGVKGMKWGVRRYRNEDGTLTAAGKKRYADQEPVHEDYAKVHDNKSVKSMSDAELRARNNRLQMERQYEQMTKKTSRGKKAVQAFIATGALTAGVITAIGQYKNAYDKAKGTALGKKTLDAGKLAGDKALDKIGDIVLKNVKFGKMTD